MGDEQDRKFLFDVSRFLFEKRKELAEFLKPIREWFRLEEASSVGETDGDLPRILIIGPGGVGKSTLASFLVGGLAAVIDDTAYTESLQVEEFELDSPQASIVVPPGQAHRRDWAWADIERGLTEGKFRGVLLIGAYGFHSIGPLSYTSLGLPPGRRTNSWSNILSEAKRKKSRSLNDSRRSCRGRRTRCGS